MQVKYFEKFINIVVYEINQIQVDSVGLRTFNHMYGLFF
jgi:hypothetical protein